MCDACVMCCVALCGLWCLYCCAVVSSVCLLCCLLFVVSPVGSRFAVFNIYIYPKHLLSVVDLTLDVRCVSSVSETGLETVVFPVFLVRYQTVT